MSSIPVIGLLLIRLVVGVIFIAHGYVKFAVDGIAATTSFLGSLGVPYPELAAPALIALEVVGGALLVLGLGTRILGGLFAIDMLVAVLLVHLRGGFFVQDGGFEFAMLLGVLGVALALTGPGALSIDSRIGRRRRR